MITENYEIKKLWEELGEERVKNQELQIVIDSYQAFFAKYSKAIKYLCGLKKR